MLPDIIQTSTHIRNRFCEDANHEGTARSYAKKTLFINAFVIPTTLFLGSVAGLGAMNSLLFGVGTGIFVTLLSESSRACVKLLAWKNNTEDGHAQTNFDGFCRWVTYFSLPIGTGFMIGIIQETAHNPALLRTAYGLSFIVAITMGIYAATTIVRQMEAPAAHSAPSFRAFQGESYRLD